VDSVWEDMETQHFRIAGIEDFMVSVSHSFQTPRLYESSGKDPMFCSSQRKMYGTMGDLVFNQISPDTFTVSEFLNFINISLNQRDDGSGPSQSRGSKVLVTHPKGRGGKYNSTLRDVGMVVMTQIFYSNTKESLFGVTPTIYQYKAERVPKTAFLTWEPLYKGQKIAEDYKRDTSQRADVLWSESYGKLSRMVRRRSGVYIKIGQTGILGRFNINNVLFQVVSGMGLLAAGATLCELMAFYVLPNKKKLGSVIVENVEESSVSPTKARRLSMAKVTSTTTTSTNTSTTTAPTNQVQPLADNPKKQD